MKNKKIIVLTLLASLILSLGACSKKEEKITKEENKKLVDEAKEISKKPAEDMNQIHDKDFFKNLKTKDIEGEDVDVSIFKDKKLSLVNVWNTRCNPCLAELPELEKLSKEFEDKDFQIKGVVYEFTEGLDEKTKETVNDILKEKGISYGQLTVSKEMLKSEEMINLLGVPTSYFVDSEGNIVGKILCATDYKGWKARIEQAFEKVK